MRVPGSPRQLKEEFMSVIRGLDETQHQDQDLALTVMIKWALTHSDEMA